MESAMSSDNVPKEMPNIEGNKCFFCGTDNPRGLCMKFFADGEKIFSTLAIPEYLSGWNNIAHGGITSALLDEIMCWTASFFLKKLVLTRSLTIDFIRPVMTGVPIRAEGKVHQTVNDKEIIMNGFIYNSNNELLARSTGKLATFTLDQAREMNFLDSNSLNETEMMFSKM
jgi:uncharacterized protein (TIGR00369 family)